MAGGHLLPRNAFTKEMRLRTPEIITDVPELLRHTV